MTGRRYPHATLRELRHDRSGAVALLFAISLPAIIGAAAVVVDLGHLYLAKRELQGMADAAASAALLHDIASDGEGAARALIARNGSERISLESYSPGLYSADRAVAHDARFAPGADTPNAVKVELRRDVPLFFASFLVGRRDGAVTASATAARSNMVAFHLGTSLLAVSGGLPNKLLSGLAGAELNLTDAEIASLVGGRIGIMDFANSLRSEQDDAGALYGSVMDQAMPLARIVRAMAGSANPAAASVLARIAATLGSGSLAPSQVIDLGPRRNVDFDDGRVTASVDAYSLLRAMLEASHGDSYALTLDAAVPGAISARLHLVGGYADERSPWLSLDTAQNVTLNTARTRISAAVSFNTPALPGISVSLPLVADLAPAQASISHIACIQRGGSDNGVTVAVTPSVGRVALAATEANKLDDLSQPLALSNAQLVNTPLLSLTGFADATLGGQQSQSVHFSAAEIAARTSKSVATRDLASATITALLTRTSYQAKVLGIGIGTSGLGNQVVQSVAGSLAALAPGIDSLLDGLEAAAGVRLGIAEVGVVDLRCGEPIIVA